MAMKYVRISQSGAGTQTIEAAVAGQRHIVISFGLDVSLVTALPQFESAATVIAGPFGNAVGAIGPVASTRDVPLFRTAINEALELVNAGAGLTTGFVVYYTTEGD